MAKKEQQQDEDDPKLLKKLVKGLEDIKNGKLKSWKQVKQEGVDEK